MISIDLLNKYRKYLAEQGKLYTRERESILQSAFAREDHFSADDLYFHMRQEGIDVSRATLYRNLKQMAEAGLLNEADFGHGHTHYERAHDGAPHEHLVCKKCGRVTEVNAQDLGDFVRKAAQSQGFQIDHYQIQILGTCKACQSV
jgi:Fur family ferric uptake transcriptional regulator